MSLTVQIQKNLANYSLEVDFELERQPLGLLGRSGSGKSLTLRCIAGIDTPDAGRIVLNDRVLYDSRRGINLPSRDRRVGFVFQNYALFPHLTVRDNIAYGLKGCGKAERLRRVEEQLQQVQLLGLGDRYPHQLSGGQQQRVALARALAPEPDLLLLDEPFSALDAHLRSELEIQLSQTLADYRGLTLFVSHNLEEAYRLCPHLLVLSQGRMIAQGAKQSIFDNPGTVTVAQLTGCKNYSRLELLSSQQIRALDWNCTLETQGEVSPLHTHVGIRAHHLVFLEGLEGVNSFPAWLAGSSETPHRQTLYLKLGEPPASSQDYHVRGEVFKEVWEGLKCRPFPWFVGLLPSRLLLLEGGEPRSHGGHRGGEREREGEREKGGYFWGPKPQKRAFLRRFHLPRGAKSRRERSPSLSLVQMPLGSSGVVGDGL